MIKTVFALVVGSGSQAVSNSAAALLATAVLPPEERGGMVLALAVASLVSIIGGLGTGMSLRVLLPTSSAPERLLSAYLCTSVAMVAAAGGTAAVISLSLHGNSAELGIACGVYSAVLLANLQLTELRFAIGQFKSGAYWATAGAVMGFVGVLVGVGVGVNDSSLLLYQGLGVAAVSLAHAGVLAWDKLLSLNRTGLSEVLLLLRNGWSPLIWSLGIVVLSKSERLVLGQYETSDAVAVYALGVTLAELVRLVPLAISQLVTRIAASGESLDKVWRYVVAATACSAAVGLVALPTSLFFIRGFLDPIYQGAIPVMAILLVGEVCMAIYLTTARALQGIGYANVTARIGLIVAVLAVPAYFAAGGAYGVIGIAMTLSSAYGALGLCAGLVLYRHWRRSEGRLRATSAYSG